MLEYLLALLPFYESRYAIPLLIFKGENPIVAFLLSSLLNLLVFPGVVLFLNKVNDYFLNFNFYKKLYTKIVSYVSRRKSVIEKYGYFGLFLFVFIPLPTTGVYTASILSWLLDLDLKKSFAFVATGIFSANLLITLLSLGVLKLL